MKKDPKYLFGTLLLLALLGPACWFGLKAVAQLFAEPQGTVAGQDRLVGGAREAGLAIEGWVDHNRVLKDDRLQAWYRLSNLGSDPIDHLQIHVQAPGLALPAPPRGWPAQAFPLHVLEQGDAVLRSTDLPRLAPGASITVHLDLPVQRTGDAMLTAWFNWTGRGEMHAEALELGPLHLRSTWLEQTAAWKDFVIALLPLLIPLLVLPLGFWIQNRQQVLAQERQAWATMVPASHKNNMRLYVPLISTIETFTSWLDSYKDNYRQQRPTAADLRRALFYLFQTVSCMRKVDKSGGYHLRNRAGEQAITDCMNALLDEIFARFDPYEKFSAVVDEIKPTDTLSAYHKKLDGDPALKLNVDQLEAKFQTWITDSAVDLDLPALAGHLLLFEINRFNYFWYGSLEKFPFGDLKPILQGLFKPDGPLQPGGLREPGGPLKGKEKAFYDYAKMALTRKQRAEMRRLLGLPSFWIV
jgi:hypothetical protein